MFIETYHPAYLYEYSVSNNGSYDIWLVQVDVQCKYLYDTGMRTYEYLSQHHSTAGTVLYCTVQG